MSIMATRDATVQPYVSTRPKKRRALLEQEIATDTVLSFSDSFQTSRFVLVILAAGAMLICASDPTNFRPPSSIERADRKAHGQTDRHTWSQHGADQGPRGTYMGPIRGHRTRATWGHFALTQTEPNRGKTGSHSGGRGPSDPLAPRKNCAANPTMLALLKLCCQPQPRLLCENRAANNTPLAL